MSNHIKWEPSLIKKYSSTNHFRLLNQLRNEIKAYPLKRTVNDSSTKKSELDPTIKKQTNQLHPKNTENTDNTKLDQRRMNNPDNISKLHVQTNSSLTDDNHITPIFRSSHKDITSSSPPPTSKNFFNNTFKRIEINTDNHQNQRITEEQLSINCKQNDINDDKIKSDDNNQSDIRSKDQTLNHHDHHTSSMEQPIEVPISFMDRLSQIEMR